MILTDNETKVDLLNNEAIAATIVALLREKPGHPITVGVHGDWGDLSHIVSEWWQQHPKTLDKFLNHDNERLIERTAPHVEC
jgi:hypothetical protein